LGRWWQRRPRKSLRQRLFPRDPWKCLLLNTYLILLWIYLETWRCKGWSAVAQSRSWSGPALSSEGAYDDRDKQGGGSSLQVVVEGRQSMSDDPERQLVATS